MRRGSLKWAGPTTIGLVATRARPIATRRSGKVSAGRYSQVSDHELERAQLAIGEALALEEERRLLLNFEKLTALSDESYRLIYEDNEAALTRVRQAMKRVAELAEYESTFADYREGLEAASAVLEDLAFSLRGFSDKLEFSPARLAEIEDRLVEISRLKRKYGGSIESSLEHLARSEDRLRQVEHSAERELQLRAELSAARMNYLERASKLHTERMRAAKKFEQAVERGLVEVAMESARFQVQITAPGAEWSTNGFLFFEFGH